MDQFLVALISPLVGIAGTLIISGFGVALGGATRYGLPVAYRSGGGRVIASLSIALMLALIVGAAIDDHARTGLRNSAPLLAVWLPGFVAASLGAGRWILAASVPVGMVLGYAATIVGFVQSPL